MFDWIPAATVAELQPGAHRVVDVDGTSVVVFNVGGAFHAVENVCTHDGGELTGGCVEGDQIVCPRHGARFSVVTGEALSAPAYEPVPVFPVKVEGDRVFVRDDRWD
jgi:3-phenylpropionate/trans-cinnamate dioxygenase ferredoxin subunit